MERLISTAWRAFWVGLGASAVLIAQSVIAAPVHQDDTAQVAPAPVTSAVAHLPLRPQS